MLLTSAQHCCAQRSQLNEMLRHVTGIFLCALWEKLPAFYLAVISCSLLLPALPCGPSMLCVVLLMSLGGFGAPPALAQTQSAAMATPSTPHSPPIAGGCTDAWEQLLQLFSSASPSHRAKRETVRETANSPIPSSFPERLGTAGGSCAQPSCPVPQNC